MRESAIFSARGKISSGEGAKRPPTLARERGAATWASVQRLRVVVYALLILVNDIALNYGRVGFNRRFADHTRCRGASKPSWPCLHIWVSSVGKPKASRSRWRSVLGISQKWIIA